MGAAAPPAAAGAKAAPETRYIPHTYTGVTGIDMTKLEHCPDFNERKSLLNGVTPAVAYPAAGFNCNSDYALAQGGPGTGSVGGLYVNHAPAGLAGFAIGTLEHCPDFNERKSLLNGVTPAVAYPAAGFNCNKDYGLAQGGPGTGSVGGLYVNHAPAGLAGFAIGTLEHCPDFNERKSLLNGVTPAVAYPAAGFNCNKDYGLAQGGPGTGSVGGLYVNHAPAGLAGFAIGTLEHCPDFNERKSLLNGVTPAVAYPAAGFNCNKDYGLAQGGPGTGAVGTLFVNHVYTDNAKIEALEHCPNFNERMTLLNGVTKAVSYPNAGYNCNAHQ